VWTIGWGTTSGVTPGLVWTKKQAEQALQRDLGVFEAAVTRHVSVPMNQNQFDALVSFVYNIGETQFAGSSVLKRFNAGDPVGAARAFALWNKSKGKVMPGLVTRRAREAALFTKPADDELPDDQPVMPQAVDSPSDATVGSRKIAAARMGEGTVVGGGLTVAASVSYFEQAATFIKSYGLEIAVVFGFVLVAYFAAIKHFTRQDHAEGRYVSSGEAQ
jgi:lysozyme